MDISNAMIPVIDYKPYPIKKMYNIGIIGCGFAVNTLHMPAYKKAGFQVVAVCDKNAEALKSTMDKWGIGKGFTDYKELLKLEDIDIIDLAIPTFGRMEIVREATKAGKHIFIQKPVSRSVAEVKEMIECADANNVKIGVNSHSRWFPSFRGAWSLIKQGYIGEPHFIDMQMCHNQDEVYWYDMPERRWNAELTDFITVEWGAHLFDFTRFWVGSEPDLVYMASTRHPSQIFKSDMICNYILEFPKGLIASYTINQANKSKELFWKFRIEGSNGVIKGEQPSHLELYSKKLGDNWLVWDLPTDTSMGLPDSYIGCMGDLMNAITDNREHISSIKDNINTLKICLAGIRSRELHRPVAPWEVDEI